MSAGLTRCLKKPIIRTCILIFLAIIALSCYFIIRAYHYPVFVLRMNDESESFQGYTLFALTVADIGLKLEVPNTIYLIGMKGEIVHSWQVMGSTQLAKLKPNGNLLYSTRDRSFKPRAGLREIDPFGNVVWYYNCWIDHDFHVLENGNILLHYIEDKEVPEISPGDIRCSRIIELTPEKDIIWEWRGEDHLDELKVLLGITFPLENPEGLHIVDGAFDWAHNNSCQVITENATASLDSRFQPGNILFSYCNLNSIGVIDRESGRIVWAWGPGKLDGQHDPRMMKNGNLLIFDNGTERGYSRVIELNPLSEEIVWEYSDRDSRNPEFYSEYKSSAQLLMNGNVFICQDRYRPSDMVSKFYHAIRRYLFRKKIRSSRLFEVNRSKEIVWETVINLSAEDTYGIYQATRYPESYVIPLFDMVKKVEMKLDSEEVEILKSLPYVR